MLVKTNRNFSETPDNTICMFGVFDCPSKSPNFINMNAGKHILQELGILKSFSIRQQMTVEEFSKLYSECSKNTKSDIEIKKKFEKVIEDQSLEQIPGIIPANAEEKRIEDLTNKSKLIAAYFLKYKLTKKEQVFMLKFIASNLHLTSEDFEDED